MTRHGVGRKFSTSQASCGPSLVEPACPAISTLPRSHHHKTLVAVHCCSDVSTPPPSKAHRATACCHPPRRVITFRPVTGEPISADRVGASAGNDSGAERQSSSTGGASPFTSRSPSPASSVSVRSTPANSENGASLATVALLTR